MIFRRFLQQLREQNWAAIGIEFLLLVLGVFLGLQAQDWADERAARAEERALLSSLRAEFVEARAEILRQIDKHKSIEADTAYVLQSLSEAERQGESQIKVMNTRVAWALVATTTQLSQGELKGILSTGRLRLIQNTELRQALANWEAVLEDATEDEVRSRVLVSEHFEPLLWRLMDTRAIRDYESLFKDQHKQDVMGASDMPVDRELMGAFSTRRFWVQHIIREWEGPRDEAERIIQLIDASLGS